MAIHVLGNGPSIEFFKIYEWSAADLRIGCNLSDAKLRPYFTVMVDVKPIRLFTEKDYKLSIPVILSDKAMDYIQHDLKNRFDFTRISLKEVVPLIHWTDISKTTPMNSGQQAVMIAIRDSDDWEDIHIWGTDSLWSDELKSSSDIHMRPHTNNESRIDSKRADIWRKYWERIFSLYPNRKFIIHGPKSAYCQITANNLKFEAHSKPVDAVEAAG